MRFLLIRRNFLKRIARATHIERIGDGEADDARRGRVSSECGEERREEDDAVADELESHGQPSVGHVVEIATLHVGVHFLLGRVHEARLTVVGSDGGGALDALAQMAVDWGARDAFQTLQLARGRDVVALQANQ